jgi:hypothetical protein
VPIKKTAEPSIGEGLNSECLTLRQEDSLRDGLSATVPDLIRATAAGTGSGGVGRSHPGGHLPLTWGSLPGATLERSFEHVSSAN